MTTAEKLYQIIQNLPEEQINEVLQFAELLQHKLHSSPSSKSIPPGTLTGLRGIIKRRDIPNDQQLQAEYTDYLIEKYQ
ncbi:MAG: DUF2281 domain-containing protein [Pseudanabaenaceae cyanobacterium]|jgi:hypothetical protein